MTATVPAVAKHRNDGRPDPNNEGWRQPPPAPTPLPVPQPNPPWPGPRPSSGYRGAHRLPGMLARLAARLLGGAR